MYIGNYYNEIVAELNNKYMLMTTISRTACLPAERAGMVGSFGMTIAALVAVTAAVVTVTTAESGEE